jgi:flagellar hook-length control protein FliK
MPTEQSMTLNTTLATALPPSSAATSATSAPGATHAGDATPGDAGAAGFAHALSAAGERRVAGRSTTEPDSSSPAPAADAASPVLPLAEWVIPWIAPITPASASPGGRAAASAETSIPLAATAGATDPAGVASRPDPATGLPSGAFAATAVSDALPSSSVATDEAAEPATRSSALVAALSSAASRISPGGTPPNAVPQDGAASGTPPAAAVAQAAAPAAVAVTAPAADDAAAGPPSASPAPRARAEVPDAPLAVTSAAEGKRAPDAAPATADAARKELALPTAVLSGAVQPAAVRESTAPALAVAAAVGTPGWHEDVAQKFAHVVSLRLGEAEIRLNPAHLGPVGIEISYGDNQASVLITAAQPATRDALEQALPHLRELLAQQGIALGESTVRDQPGGEGATGAANTSRRVESARAADAGSGTLPTDTATGRGRRPSGLIDTFA